jgi:integrase
MSRPSRNQTYIPKHCHHKASNRGVVRLNGRDHYTGPWDTPEANAEYRRLIAEWLANHRLPVPSADAAGDRQVALPLSVTVAEMMLAFWHHVQQFYRRPDGTPTGEELNFKYALRPARQLYGDLPAADFSPLKLRAVRQQMIDAGLSRGVINGRVSRIVRMFRWGVAEELVPETVHGALEAVAPLREGRSEAREPQKVKPVPDEQIAAVLPLLAPQVRAMVELQRLTGLRSSEVCQLRGADLDTSGDIWVYRPAQHKTLHHGKRRVVFIGPRAQAILGPWQRADPDAYLFSPREAMAAFRESQRAARKSKVQPSQICRRKRTPRRQPGECYTFRSYGAAVRRACTQAYPLPTHLRRRQIQRPGGGSLPETPAEWRNRIGPAGLAEVLAWRRRHTWHPHQIRHTRGTEVRKVYKLEGAQVALGHAHAKITEVYAERDYDLARKIAADMG